MLTYLKLIISVAIPLVAGFAGSLFTSQSLEDWYPALRKPFFTPPNWLFFPVWTTLFVLMGIAFYLVWQRNFAGHRVVLYLYCLQLVANVMWSWFFFGLRRPEWALVDILVLWVLILACIVSFYRISHLAGYLLLPYLGWVSLASFLNYFIVRLN
ncbi:TspO/MBR family protein [Atrimonas thermophila]|jgi:tryptophan-rich sensory protein|uniref:TspO/MBR family protein n=1 Tax=Atrimonas thermophila TaxID=3064161 RepID=UPI00399CCB5C